ncbi:hypothetical protein JJL56_30325 [Azospirillum sp. YIM DDC1]|uniref:Calcium-binding protein n=2 Tax=Azospirillum aestuarii TaxID=2802052 RepID=A0ABS1I7V7_9PROT|nr:hypothetical protein [Azospirillum aestuarii]
MKDGSQHYGIGLDNQGIYGEIGTNGSGQNQGGKIRPVVLDLDRDGVELIDQNSSCAFYDVDGDGFKENVGWAKPEDGILAIDVDRNGLIEMANEINFTLHSVGAQTDLDGISNAFDSNRDGILDSKDERFSDFRIWQDFDSDGVSDTGEVKTLTEAGVNSIELTGPRIDVLNNGNPVARYTSFTRSDGSIGQVADAGLMYSAFGYRISDGALEVRGGSLNSIGAGNFTGTLIDESNNSLLVGGIGSQNIEGGGGSDWLIGGEGSDILSGGDGHDILFIDREDNVDGGLGFDIAVVVDDHGIALNLKNANIEAVQGGLGDDTFTGGTGNEYFSGENGNDHLSGGSGIDSLYGGNGDDRLSGGTDADIVDGGAGYDLATFQSSSSGVGVSLEDGRGWMGEASGDVYISIEGATGSEHSDYIIGNGQGNWIAGLGSNDTLIGQYGNDTLMGGWGEDYLAGGADNDSLIGDDGFDTLVGGTGDDALFGGGHNDTLSGEDGNDTLVGGWGEDYLAGGNHNDVLFGEDGYDLLAGGAGEDNLFGGGHNDTLFGEDGNDTLSGDGGDDHLHGQNGNDTLFGNDGSDWLTGGTGADWLDGGAGWDSVNYNASWGAVGVDLADGVAWSAEGEGDRLINIEGVQGSQHNDDLRGDGNNNWLHGQGGDDWLFGRGGADILDGGDGFDVANYVDSATGVSVDLRNGTASGGSADGDQLHNIEGVHGSIHDDHLHGNDATNWLYGSWGNDWLHGYGSDDSLYGDTGNDSLNGGWGADNLFGGAGSDWATYMWASSGIGMTLEGNYGWLGEAAGDKFYDIENILGSEHGDEIYGDWQGNYLVGAGGNDALLGKDGHDTLVGGWGDDYMEGGGHNDVLVGEDGHDYVVGGWGEDYLAGGNHNDTLIGDDGHDTLVGGANEDYLVGGNNNDVLHGEDGYDTLFGGANEDYLHGGGHNDTLIGDDGYDTLVGGWGEDYLHGGGHNDALHGEDGHDYLVGGWGEDYLVGGNNNDTLIGEDGHDTLIGGANEDYLVGGNNNDVLHGEDGYDTLFGGANEDYLHGGGHNDHLLGDDGYDTLVGGWGDDWMSGGGHNDALHGEDGNDAMHGGWGDDNLLGGEGGDWLVGEEGNDGINGGGGYDTAYFAGSRSNHYIHYVSNGHGAIIDATGRNGGDWVWETERLWFDDAVAYFDGSQGWPPLVIDLDGDGLELTDVFESTVRFDMTGDGIVDRTGWAAADDGLIVYDLGGDRKITGQAEVVLATHGEAGMTDLEALAYAFDDNRDGWFDANDAQWKDFGIWQDRNQDGITDDGEFRTLDEAGIVRIGLVGEGLAEVVAGNVINSVTRFETADGREGLIGDVTLYAQSGVEADRVVIAANDDVSELPSLENALHGLAAAMALFDAQGEAAVEEMPTIVDDALYPLDDALSKAA